jgi:hypothetical protein
MNIGDFNMRKGEEYYYSQMYNRKAERSIRTFAYSLVVVILIVVVSLLLSGCKSIQYIPVEKVKTEYINKTDTFIKKDTVISKKETIIREADSTLITKLGLQLKDNEKAILILQRELEKQISKESESKTDTVIKTDSVQVPYPVERKLTKWEQTKMDAGGIAIGVCIAVIIMIIIGFIAKAYKKT